MDFDHNGKAIFENYDRISRDYIESTSTERTLSEYYSRRQYPGSPPEIPHPLEAHGIELECLTCHANGGWTEPLKRITPVTPPSRAGQLHARATSWPVTDKTIQGKSTGRVSRHPVWGVPELPGAPVPIPHDLQMRGNCIACHVGPGTVTAIRVEHPSRGNCRQCHVPETNVPLFERKPKS